MKIFEVLPKEILSCSYNGYDDNLNIVRQTYALFRQLHLSIIAEIELIHSEKELWDTELKDLEIGTEDYKEVNERILKCWASINALRCVLDLEVKYSNLSDKEAKKLRDKVKEFTDFSIIEYKESIN